MPHCISYTTLSCAPVQILVAVSRKLTLAPSVDFDQLSSITEGFSGVDLDLQALVYNAHLEVVHAAIDAEKADGGGGGDVEAGGGRGAD